MQELWERVISLRTPSFSRRGQGVVNPAAFLFRMLKNLAIDEHRKRKNEISLDENVIDESYLSHVTHPSHTAGFEQPSEIEALILESLEKLPKEDHELLVLNIYSGYNYSQIAEMVGKSTEAIWQRASRARAKLRTIVIDDAKRMGIALPKVNGNIHKKTEAKV